MVNSTLPQQPLVSIVIAAYNCEDTVHAAVESCLAQTYPHTEVIVVNDGSTDGTAAVLTSFGSRIRVVDQENGGLASARNAGTREAGGEFIAWMDADDLATPDRVTVQAGVLAANPQIAVVCSDFSAFTSEGMPLDASHIDSYYDAYVRLGGAKGIYSQRSIQKVNGSNHAVWRGPIYEHLLWGNFVHPPTVMARRTFLDRAGAFDESLRCSSDYDLIIRLARLGDFAFVDAPLLRYRRSEKQMSSNSSSGAMPLETVKILDKIRASDPAVFSRCAPLFRLRTAESLVSAASAIGPSARGRALSLLWAGLTHRLVLKASIVALIRIVLPDRIRRSVVGTLRHVSRRGIAYLATGASTTSLMQDDCIMTLLCN